MTTASASHRLPGNLSQRWVLLCLALLAFALRVYHLGSPPLLWDEGWSIGLSRLPLGEIARITALDVHPPLYYLLLKGWLLLGPHEFVTRFLSVLAGVLSVPLAYQVGRAWRGSGVGLLTGLYVAVAPPLVYYSQITRMFALCVAFLFLATYGLLTLNGERATTNGQRRRASSIVYRCAFFLGALGALYTFYYAGLVLAALFVYALVTAPRHWRRTVGDFVIVALLYLPWVVYATPPMLERVGRRTGFDFAWGAALGLMRESFVALVFPYGIGRAAVYAVLLVAAAGAVLSWRQLGRWTLLPLLTIGATLFGVALGAQAHMFAARYTIVAAPFLALGLGAAWVLLARYPVLSAAGLVLIVATTVPTLTGYVYSKSYEVLEPFDPSTDWRVLHGQADADDLVFFNVLSLAGTYERYRTPDDPVWSYALRWDPVIEPLEIAQARVEEAVQQHKRLWFVLYKGTVGANAELKAWLDKRFYPAAAPGWRGDTLYLAYVQPQGPWRTVELGVTFEGGIVLQRARFTQAHAGVVGIELEWWAQKQVARDAKVFVHLYDAVGQLIAQHDAFPANDTRPPSTWHPGERVLDRHGLALPEGVAGPWRLVVGLYDPDTGKRLRAEEGQTEVVLGQVNAAE